MSRIYHYFKSTLNFVWRAINLIRRVILNLLVISLVIGIIVTLTLTFNTETAPVLKPNTALVLNLSGNILDQKHILDPVNALLSRNKDSQEQQEILLSDVIKSINAAAKDNHIQAIVLNLDQLQKAGLSKLQSIGDALTQFKQSGKAVFAYGNFFTQEQYFLASFADKLYLNPDGGVLINGLSRYRLYFKDALDKLDVTTHVFRVGTYKSAIEPFIRDNMSPQAKKANQALLDNLWQTYVKVVAENRHLSEETFTPDAANYLSDLDKANGDPAQAALNNAWVDKLLTADEFNQLMISKIGTDNDQVFRQINFADFLSHIKQSVKQETAANIGIIVAQGQILNGKQAVGETGGESTSALLRQARFDDQIKAVVLRVDSPGGSAFASEQIRQQVIALQKQGKPVVVSMGNLAASGGYWISANADYIYATPTTITGSIGIFGLVTTFNKMLDKLGIHTDGVATSNLAGLTLTRELSPQVAQLVQRYVERGYVNFVNLVANARHMSVEQVDAIAQGRVWTGSQAVKLGLVDELGDMQQAVAKAAKLARLTSFNTRVIKQELTPDQRLIQELFSGVISTLPNAVLKPSFVDQTISQINKQLTGFANFNDPNGLYLYCDLCDQ